MVRQAKSTGRRSSEDASASTKKKPVSKKAPSKKKNNAMSDDDDSIDSHGNIRGLIDYNYESNDSDYIEEEDEQTSESEELPPAKRSKKAAPAPAPAPAPKKKNTIVSTTSQQRRNAFSGAIAAAEAVARRSKKLAPPTPVTDSEEEEDSDEDVVVSKSRNRHRPTASRRRRSAERSRRRAPETESEEEEEDEDDDENEFLDEEEYDEDEDEDYDEEEESTANRSRLIISLGAADDDEMSKMIPKRHNMKKETSEVKKFVELITKPIEDNDIDSQIDQFKALDVEKRKTLLKALEERPTATDSSMSLMFRILTMKLPKDTQAMVLAKYQSLQSMDPSTGEYFKLRNWLDKLCSVPFGNYKEMPVRIDEGADKCGQFMEKAMKYLDDAVYAQNESKLQILQFIASKIANPTANGLSLLLVGPPGIGKTSLIKNGIAKALDWPFQFISLGGDSDATTYTGHQLVYESSHSGKIVNSLCAAKSMSTVLLFDELDKISQTPKGEEVQNLLVHLTDPVQNAEFEDKYLSGIPVDLSKVMFVFSANDINKIDRILLDRMLVVKLEGYNPKDKLVIADQYLLPVALKEVNLAEKVNISKEIMQHVIETYAKEENGVRELKRCIESIVQKINMLRMYNDKSLPFYIKDFSLPFVVKKEHVDLFLKKKESQDKVPFGMYM